MLPLMVEAATADRQAEHIVRKAENWYALRRLLKRLPVDVIHAWSQRAMVMAVMAAATGKKMTATLTAPPAISELAVAIVRRADVTLLVPSEHLRQHWLARGLRDEQVRVAAPPMSPGEPSGQDRTATRMSWGVTDERTSVVLATGPVPGAQDAMLAMLSAGLAAETGRQIRLLISPRAAGLHRARRMAAASGRDTTLIIHEAADKAWEVRPAIDLALAMNDGPGVTWAMLTGLPIAGHASPALSERLRHDETALLGRKASPGEIARCLCRLHDDPALAQRLAEAARREVRGVSVTT